MLLDAAARLLPGVRVRLAGWARVRERHDPRAHVEALPAVHRRVAR